MKAGNGSRWVGGGNGIDAMLSRTPTAGVFAHFQKAYCETCKQHKPKPKLVKRAKGWKCADCKNRLTRES